MIVHRSRGPNKGDSNGACGLTELNRRAAPAKLICDEPVRRHLIERESIPRIFTSSRWIVDENESGKFLKIAVADLRRDELRVVNMKQLESKKRLSVSFVDALEYRIDLFARNRGRRQVKPLSLHAGREGYSLGMFLRNLSAGDGRP